MKPKGLLESLAYKYVFKDLISNTIWLFMKLL